jgi:hypothetical protein
MTARVFQQKGKDGKVPQPVTRCSTGEVDSGRKTFVDIHAVPVRGGTANLAHATVNYYDGRMKSR